MFCALSLDVFRPHPTFCTGTSLLAHHGIGHESIDAAKADVNKGPVVLRHKPPTNKPKCQGAWESKQYII